MCKLALEEYNEINSAAQTLFLVGEIRYQLQDDAEAVTSFAYRYVSGENRWGTCPRFNEMT